jgi:hypothetical protein
MKKQIQVSAGADHKLLIYMLHTVLRYMDIAYPPKPTSLNEHLNKQRRDRAGVGEQEVSWTGIQSQCSAQTRINPPH